MHPLLAAATLILGSQTTHKFELSPTDFLMDGKPFEIRSGEMHPARIPEQYWQHRIRMAKAMGLNTIAIYVFWNFLEPEDGKFDFTSGRHNLGRFLQLCKDEGMWVLLRPGPYCCGEWDFGGLPPYLLKYPDLKVRCMDPHYIAAMSRYLGKLAAVVRPYQVSQGGPILMVQLENEYGSYGNDRNYIAYLHKFWRDHGIEVPFYTADGPTPYMLEAGSYPGCAVGLDSGLSDNDYAVETKMNPGVPAFSSETYPGWLTHWGEGWARTGADSIVGEVRWLLDHHKSFNLYMVHGGTNFGFTAGANSGGHGYEPDITSYDYDAPITEQGRATPKYLALRDVILQERPNIKAPAIPDPIPAGAVAPISMTRIGSLFDYLPSPVSMAQPKPFEALGQKDGCVLYRTKLIGHKSGRLTVKDVHDWALVLEDGQLVGTLDRREGRNSIDLPEPSSATPTLDILVEGMGRINFSDALIDRKGITDRVTLNGMTLMTWQAFPLPLDETWITGLKPSRATSKPASIFAGTFNLANPEDTYLDLSHYKKGYIWINGHNLGRYWDIGPQKRLYCPAPWLRKGRNELRILDFLTPEPAAVESFPDPG